MIEENNLFQHKSACALPKFNCMTTSLQHTSVGCLPTSQMFSVSVSMPESAVCDTNPDTNMIHVDQALPFSFIPHTPTSKMGQVGGAAGFLQNPSPNASPSAVLCPMKIKPGLMNANTGKTLGDALSECMLKGFHIFDRSGSQTRLIYSSIYPHAPDAIATTTKLPSYCDVHDGHAFKANLFSPLQPSLPKKLNENLIGDEEDEMHEDSEEINALLYSSEEDGDSYDEDDEIMSTGHSPIAIKRRYEKLGLGEEIIGEVSSFDGRNKRRKQLGGVDMEPSISDTASSLNLEGSRQCVFDVESSCQCGHVCGEKMDCLLDKNPLKKDNIHATLKILEAVVPGAKGKEPLLVLDKAIDYLKTLKLEARRFGVN